MDDAAGGERTDDRQALHALLFEQMNVAVIATDPDLRITAWNRAAEALYGWAADEAIGRRPLEVVGPFFAPGEREALLARLENGEPPRPGAGGARPLLVQHHRNGRLLVAQAQIEALSADGALLGYVAVVREMRREARLAGDLAESEAKYRNLVERSPDAILIHQDGSIVFANPAAAALVGAASPGDLVGRPVLAIVHPDARRHVEWNISADLRGEESPITLLNLVRDDGSTVTVQGRGARIPLGGRPAVQVILRDVARQP